jgi:RNA-binding protein Tab2/Atab2
MSPPTPHPSWQLDFYRRPLQDDSGAALWELLICDPQMRFSYSQTCPQPTASAAWLRAQIEQAMAKAEYTPTQIEVFRPQTLTLTEVACRELSMPVVAKRTTTTLKQWLSQRTTWYPSLNTYTGEPYDPFQLERPAPVPLPDNLWGEQWRFAGLPNPELLRLQYEAIPICTLPQALMPLELGLASTVLIPGIVIDARRNAMRLAQWIASTQPLFVQFLAGTPDGLILEAGLVERWVLVTFDDPEVHSAAHTFEQRKQAAQGLHFLLVRPDDSGMTYTGLWLLQDLHHSV